MRNYCKNITKIQFEFIELCFYVYFSGHSNAALLLVRVQAFKNTFVDIKSNYLIKYLYSQVFEKVIY